MRYETPDDERRYHYWRGFRAAVIALVPLFLLLTVALYLAIDTCIALLNY